jgi:ubiquinone/menaquinone biosynthesis C-methylase UbiE
MINEVERHYSMSGRLPAAIRDELITLGKDVCKLEPKDLETIDEFHIRGRAATLDLAHRLNIARGSLVLDVGSGLGGPARTIATSFNCHVIGVDLTRDFCEAAREITRWVGLSDSVTFVQGDATVLDLRSASFDVAVTMHAAMNIERKAEMYAGVRRCLKPCGRFGIYDVVQGEGGQVHFPVPWARDASISHLATPAQMRSLLDDAGFTIEQEIDSTEASATWFKEKSERLRATKAAPLGFRLFLGELHAEMVANQVKNLAERRIGTVTYVARAKPASRPREPVKPASRI